MKTFRKGNDFKRVKDFSMDDFEKMNSLLKDGWSYCPKKEYKDFFKEEKTATEIKAEAKAEAKSEEKKSKKSKK